MSEAEACGYCGETGGRHSLLWHGQPEDCPGALIAGLKAKVRSLEVVAKLAHHFVRRGDWRPGGVQAIARALLVAGYDVGQPGDE